MNLWKEPLQPNGQRNLLRLTRGNVLLTLFMFFPFFRSVFKLFHQALSSSFSRVIYLSLTYFPKSWSSRVVQHLTGLRIHCPWPAGVFLKKSASNPIINAQYQHNSELSLHFFIFDDVHIIAWLRGPCKGCKLETMCNNKKHCHWVFSLKSYPEQACK